MDFLGWITDFTATLPQWSIWALGSGLSFAESGLGLGLVFPGETAILIVSAALTNPASAVVMAVLVALSACAGDHVGYLLGRRYGPRIRETRIVRRFGVQHWDRSIGLLERQGARAILFTRPVPIVRILTPAATGVAGATYPRFLAASFSGAAVWAVLYVGLGYLLRSSLDAVEKYLSSFGWLVTGVLVAVVVVAVVRSLLKRRREKTGRALESPTAVGRRIVDLARRRPLTTVLVVRSALVVAFGTLILLHLLVPASVVAGLLVASSMPPAWLAMVGPAVASGHADGASARATAALLAVDRLLPALASVALALTGLAPWILAGTLALPLLGIGLVQVVRRHPTVRPLPCDTGRAIAATTGILLIPLGLATPMLRFATGLGTLALFAAIVLAYVDCGHLCRRLMSASGPRTAVPPERHPRSMSDM